MEICLNENYKFVDTCCPDSDHGPQVSLLKWLIVSRCYQKIMGELDECSTPSDREFNQQIFVIKITQDYPFSSTVDMELEFKDEFFSKRKAQGNHENQV